MAARPCADGLSVECVRLRLDRAAGAGTDGVADRPLGPDVSQRGDLRKSGGVDRWKFARTTTVDRAHDGARAARPDGNLRWHSLEPATHHDGGEGETADHAAEPAAGRTIQL